ncbi:hypothetical protein [Bradyrhizobium algeriense]|uniref:hypothetical protein n=1 Tax=Bradyrhizobium algeriense TaxID=634784 RepID=UPI000D3CD312|nr:hypothetical protein [Bradyrhizobium algeriense]
MAQLSERAASGSCQPGENAEAEAAKLNQSALEFMLGAQKMMLEELIFFGDEMLERTRIEMQIFNEFVTKMAGAHSVRDVRTMYQQCGEHQLDFFRRDSERLFKHSERMIATTSKLIKGLPLN